MTTTIGYPGKKSAEDVGKEQTPEPQLDKNEKKKKISLKKQITTNSANNH
jgi:hypothetical protein